MALTRVARLPEGIKCVICVSCSSPRRFSPSFSPSPSPRSPRPSAAPRRQCRGRAPHRVPRRRVRAGPEASAAARDPARHQGRRGPARRHQRRRPAAAPRGAPRQRRADEGRSSTASKLSPAGQTNYDIWETELQRMELQYKYRRYQPPFYSFLYSVHSQLPDFLINTHTVSDAADMRAYNARLRAIPAVLDTAIAQTQAVGCAGDSRAEVRDRAGDQRQQGDHQRRAVRRRQGFAAVGRRQGQGRQARRRPARSRQPRPTRCSPIRARRSWR